MGRLSPWVSRGPFEMPTGSNRALKSPEGSTKLNKAPKMSVRQKKKEKEQTKVYDHVQKGSHVVKNSNGMAPKEPAA